LGNFDSEAYGRSVRDYVNSLPLGPPLDLSTPEGELRLKRSAARFSCELALSYLDPRYRVEV
jgi:hypothetical protein